MPETAVRLIKTLESRWFDDPWGFGVRLRIKRLGTPAFAAEKKEITSALETAFLREMVVENVASRLADAEDEDVSVKMARLRTTLGDALEPLVLEKMGEDPEATTLKSRRLTALLVEAWEGVPDAKACTPKHVLAKLLDPKCDDWLPRFTDAEGNQCRDPRGNGSEVLATLDDDVELLAPEKEEQPLPEGYTEWEFGGQPMTAAWESFILDRATKVQKDYDDGLGVMEKN